MVEWFYQIQLWFALGSGLLLVLLGLFGRVPSGFSLGLAVSVEGLLVAQLAVSLGMVIAGSRAEVDTWEYFG